jgi:excisionase family DNA binding protein
MSDEVLTTGQVGKLLGCDRVTICKMCEDEKLTGAFRLGPGGPWRIPRAAVQQLIDSGRPRKRERPTG